MVAFLAHSLFSFVGIMLLDVGAMCMKDVAPVLLQEIGMEIT